jgi:3-oxoacyl-[acyl-carrier protein] reductase
VLDLNGRVALITGASRGIGRAIALALGRRGATIIAADIRADGVSTLAQDIVAAGGRAESAVLDITDGAAVEEQVASVLARHSRLDILVNNAGIARDQLLMRMKREEWDAVLTTNLTGAFLCSQAVVRPMMKQRSGRIINISSVVGMM